MERKTNNWVLKETGTKNKDRLLAKADQAQMRYFGHVVRGNSLEREMFQGLVLERGAKEDKKTRWIHGITTLSGLRNTKATRLAENRKDWWELIQHITAARQLPTNDGAN